MRYLLLALPILLTACESLPRYPVNGEVKTVEVYGRKWNVDQITVEPVYYRATRDQTEYFLFGPPARTKTSQAVAALQKATGCKVIQSTLYRNPSDQFITQMSC
ncbi:MAG: hypothetical protein AB3N23_21215 [Paracoccaceae bacterium]